MQPSPSLEMAPQTSAVDSDNLFIPVRLLPTLPSLKSWLTSSPARRLLPLPQRHAHRTPHHRAIHPQRFPNSRLHLPNQPLHSSLHSLSSLFHICEILYPTTRRERQARLDNSSSKPWLCLPRPRENNYSHKHRRCRETARTSSGSEREF